MRGHATYMDLTIQIREKKLRNEKHPEVCLKISNTFSMRSETEPLMLVHILICEKFKQRQGHLDCNLEMEKKGRTEKTP